ncbi:electron transfer flavoprotein subunit beta/FixA family protein [Candidatus Methanoliparum sp. LAM-1]|uniref:electron transfer flavoprotein subunit beta/FixA family protein n=1 Tax=Candidatus Methanoliparum sp. LAM-1 TaxID=2874846 RepID=UPI001E480BA0|nr:electron transfer flavoprotein subunit beta/FixA family protein [Candidatus Methanoliparum sp. LAM-1]BDC35715.1 electron transfer flavoprotein subunit beta [Candidatus Methanoliparum sp. LAM-1]
MDVIVSVRKVPDTAEADVMVEKSGKDIEKSRLTFTINEWDNYAVEEAIQLKEKYGGTVTVITVGPKDVEDILRRSLAMGADKAIRVDMEDPEDAYILANVLSAVIKNQKFDLVLFGAQSGDFNRGVTGVLVARMLGITHAAMVNGIEVLDGSIKASRELEGGLNEIYDIKLPALFTIQTGINEPRYVSISGIRKARQKPLDVLTQSDLGIGSIEPMVRLDKMYLPPPGKLAEFIGGSTEEAAAKLASVLKGKGVL